MNSAFYDTLPGEETEPQAHVQEAPAAQSEHRRWGIVWVLHWVDSVMVSPKGSVLGMPTKHTHFRRRRRTRKR